MRQYRNILIAAFAFSLLLSIGGGSTGVLAQSDTNHAGLVVAFPDGTTHTYCIPFVQLEISGLDVLLGSGLDVKVQAYGSLGAEVCEIGSAGCDYPAQSCACQSYGPNGVYWSYFHLKNGKWQTSITGAGSYQVHDGDVEGWAFSAGKPPALYTFAELCPAYAPGAAPTSTPAKPTSTPIQAVPPTAVRTATRNTAPSATTRRVTPTHTQATRPVLTVTEGEPTQVPAPTSTETPIPAKSPTNTSTARPTQTPTERATSTGTPSPIGVIPSPSPTAQVPQSASQDSEGAARNVGIAIGVVVLGSLAVWGIMAMARRNGTGTRGEGGDVE